MGRKSAWNSVFTSLWWELDVLLSFGLSSVHSDKQQSKNQVMVEFILG